MATLLPECRPWLLSGKRGEEVALRIVLICRTEGRSTR